MCQPGEALQSDRSTPPRVLLQCLGSPTKNHISRIKRVQSFAAKVVTGDWSNDSKQLISSLGWPSLLTRHLYQKLHAYAARLSKAIPLFHPPFS